MSYWDDIHEKWWQCGCREVGGQLVRLCTSAVAQGSVKTGKVVTDADRAIYSSVCFRLLNH